MENEPISNLGPKSSDTRPCLIIAALYEEFEPTTLTGFSVTFAFAPLPEGNYQEALEGTWMTLNTMLDHLNGDCKIMVSSSVDNLIMDGKKAGLLDKSFRLRG